MTPSENSQHEPIHPGPSGGQAMPLLERREVFKRMVRDEIMAGTLTYSRRQRLLGYAEQIGINASHANLLIYEARRETHIEVLDVPSTLLERLGSVSSISVWQWLQLAVAITGALAIHMLLRYLLT